MLNEMTVSQIVTQSLFVRDFLRWASLFLFTVFSVLLTSQTPTSIIRSPLDIWQYIQEVRDSVCDLESRLQRTKDNVEEIQSCMRSWASPMFDRKDGKKDALLSLEDRAERLDRFYSLIRSSGEKIHFLLKVGKKKKISSWLCYMSNRL